MQISVTIDADKAIAYFNGLPSKMEVAMNCAIARSAFVFEGNAKERTPVDTGRLRASIWTMTERLSATVSTNVEYARYVHEGTSFMRGRPFMRWGLEDAAGDIRGIIQDEIERALQ